MAKETHGHRKRKHNNGSKKHWDGTYGSWREMKRRCLDLSRPDFQFYGAVGVQVCPQWLVKPGGFEQFLRDLGPRPEGHSLDRINPYGHYEPGNCRWREALANSTDNRNAYGQYESYAEDLEADSLFTIQPKWPELSVILAPLKSDDEEWPF